ncbi:NTP transferase domain-containing protein [Kushneria phosphatilytica]|uniref:phosphocholine cytidylyltransferase family protein n=1 Tax=Kushneria phosphatilytica TaxID=657387 RepID=UPI000A7DC30E|nr:phosphocholine cytidylyltransferase family protein [Kushneria phosphatilytica]
MKDSVVRTRPRRAIILSAGQGKRLLPYTADRPKCLIELSGRAVIEHQIDTLVAAGFERITVVLGYAIDMVEQRLHQRYPDTLLDIVFNPFFELADNLASCWMARNAMEEDFLILNGDTLFEPAVLDRLLDAPQQQPITLAIDHKQEYDADDMKVTMDGARLTRVGKALALDSVDGESIGMMTFRGDGRRLFQEALERNMRSTEALSRWYLSLIDELAESGAVYTASIEGLRWAELDFPHDLEHARALIRDITASNITATPASAGH